MTDDVNPYAPPQAVELDFREDAVRESSRLAALLPGRPLESVGPSLILPVEAPAVEGRLNWICRVHVLCLGVEDARTFTMAKVVPEDVAFAAFDMAGSRLVLEGVRFHYVIHAADVIMVSEAFSVTASGVQIVFRVGEVTVGLTLQAIDG